MPASPGSAPCFGRDALITALQTLWLDPPIARGVLRHLARHQADRRPTPRPTPSPARSCTRCATARWRELRRGAVRPLLRQRRFDAAVRHAGRRLSRAHRRPRRPCAELWPNIEAALALDRESTATATATASSNTAGSSDDGLVNQGWKDSHDSIFHADGTLAQRPDRAGRGAGLRLRRLARRRRDRAPRSGDDDGEPTAMTGARRRAAAALRRRLLATRSSAPTRWRSTATSGPAGCAPPTPATRCSPASPCPSAPRAVVADADASRPPSPAGASAPSPTTEARYNPMSYHNGSVWPHDNALIAAGFARYGFRARGGAHLRRPVRRLDLHRPARACPSCSAASRAQRSHGPTFYPVACSPQAWAAAAPLSLLQLLPRLALRPGERLRASSTSRCCRDFLDDVTLRQLVARRCGGSTWPCIAAAATSRSKSWAAAAGWASIFPEASSGR